MLAVWVASGCGGDGATAAGAEGGGAEGSDGATAAGAEGGGAKGSDGATAVKGSDGGMSSYVAPWLSCCGDDVRPS